MVHDHDQTSIAILFKRVLLRPNVETQQSSSSQETADQWTQKDDHSKSYILNTERETLDAIF